MVIIETFMLLDEESGMGSNVIRMYKIHKLGDGTFIKEKKSGSLEPISTDKVTELKSNYSKYKSKFEKQRWF